MKLPHAGRLQCLGERADLRRRRRAFRCRLPRRPRRVLQVGPRHAQPHPRRRPVWMRRFTGEGEAPARLDAILFDRLDAPRPRGRAEDERIAAYVGGLTDEHWQAASATARSPGRRSSSSRWRRRSSISSTTRPTTAGRCTPPHGDRRGRTFPRSHLFQRQSDGDVMNLWLRLLHLVVTSMFRPSFVRRTSRGSPSGSGRTTSTPRCT